MAVVVIFLLTNSCAKKWKGLRKMLLRVGRSVVVLLLLGVGFLARAQEQSRKFDALPSSVRAAVEEKYPGWRLVQVSDLRSDDQTLWKKSHGAKCPGLAVGHYENGSDNSYAITLFQKAPKLRQLLVVITPGLPSPKLHVLSGPQEVAYLSVVSKLPPGSYSDAEGKPVKIGKESISYEAIEAGAITYYYSDGGYRSVQSSE
jgi:hypothetical protein